MTSLEQRNAHVHPVMADILNGFTAIPTTLTSVDLAPRGNDTQRERVRYSLECHFIAWGPLDNFTTLEQAQAALASWRNKTSKPLRIVREGRQVVYSDPIAAPEDTSWP